MSQNFQTQVQIQPAPGEEGDFYGTNPRAIVIAGPGQFVAPSTPSPVVPGQNGVVVGNFCWVNTDTGAVSQSYVAGYQIGFLHRENNAVIVSFLGQATLLVQQGLPLSLFSEGDFWARFAGGATPGQKVYADPGTGAPIAGGASAPATTSFTASVGAAITALIGCSAATATSTVASVAITAVTGYISPGDVLTDGTNSATVLNQASGTPGGAGTYDMVAAPTPGAWTGASLTGTSNVLDATAVTGLISIGDTLTGSSVTTAKITGQVSGTPGGVGLYTFNGAQQEHVSEAMVISSNVLDVTAIVTGPVEPGDVITATGFTSAQITSQLSGTVGGIGLYTINGAAQHTASTATFGSGAIATPWFVNGVAAAGEMAPISTWG